MKLMKYKRSIVVVAGLFVVTAALSVYALAGTIRNDSENSHPDYPINEHGLSYGSAALATSVETEPDLVSVIGENGVNGYVYSTDLHEPMPHNPEEAAEMMKQVREPRTIVVYKEDGITAIGEFIVGGGAGFPADMESNPFS